jgi:hypothetical protein
MSKRPFEDPNDPTHNTNVSKISKKTDPVYTGPSSIFGPISPPQSRTSLVSLQSISQPSQEEHLRLLPVTSVQSQVNPLSSGIQDSLHREIYPPARMTEDQPDIFNEYSQLDECENDITLTSIFGPGPVDDAKYSLWQNFNAFLETLPPITASASVFANNITGLKTKVDEIAHMITTNINSLTETVIKESKRRKLQRDTNDAMKTIEKANALLAGVKKIQREGSETAILRMIQIETLLEDVMFTTNIDKIEDIYPLLVMPVLEIVCHYDEYFDWSDGLNAEKIQIAYAEFRNKQRVRDVFLTLYKYNATLNDVIDELFMLYNRNFNPLAFTETRILTVEGRGKLLRDIHSKLATQTVGKISSRTGEIDVLTPINYDELWSNNMASREVVMDEMQQLRAPAEATADTSPFAPVMQTGRLTRDMSISANATARFAPPVVNVMVASMGEDDYTVIDSQDVGSQNSIWSVESDKSLPILKNGKPEYPHARAQFLYSQLKNSGAEIPKKVEKFVSTLCSKKPPTLKEARMASLATERMDVANSFIKEILDYREQFISEGGPVKLDLERDMLYDIWDRHIHGIFMRWYNATEDIEQRREQLDSPPAKAESSSMFGWLSGGKGVNKYTYKFKKHHKKQTRKNTKRSTQKLRKNRKQRGGNTKRR